VSTSEGASDGLEARLFGRPDEAFDALVRRLATECALLNGLDAWTERDSAVLLDPDQRPESFPRELEGRDLVEEVGSGLIYASIEHRAGNVPTTAPMTDLERSVMLADDVATPDGSDGAGGCAAWASAAARREMPAAPERALAEKYSRELDAFLRASPERAHLDKDWSRCMAEQGYEDLERAGDHIALVLEKREQLLQEQVSDAEALEFDRRVTLAAWDCSAATSESMMQLRDEFAVRFAEEHGL